MTARIYVGTYAKYNSGSIAGSWLDCDDYTSKDDFLEACRKLHSDETDPELMFQDHAGMPAGMISESHVAPELWDGTLSWAGDMTPKPPGRRSTLTKAAC